MMSTTENPLTEKCMQRWPQSQASITATSCTKRFCSYLIPKNSWMRVIQKEKWGKKPKHFFCSVWEWLVPKGWLVPTYSPSCRRWRFGYVITEHTHTQEHREAMAGVGTPVTPCAATPRAIAGEWPSPQRLLCTHTHIYEHKGTGTPKTSVGKTEPQLPARAVPGEPSASLPRCDTHQVSQLERLSGSPYRLRWVTA